MRQCRNLKEIEIMMSSYIYTVSIVINYIIEQVPCFGETMSKSEGDQNGMDDDEWKF